MKISPAAWFSCGVSSPVRVICFPPSAYRLHHWPPGCKDQRDPSDVRGSDQDCQPRGRLYWQTGHHHWFSRQHQPGWVPDQCPVRGVTLEIIQELNSWGDASKSNPAFLPVLKYIQTLPSAECDGWFRFPQTVFWSYWTRSQLTQRFFISTYCNHHHHSTPPLFIKRSLIELNAKTMY